VNRVIERLIDLHKNDQIELPVLEFVRFLSGIEETNDSILISGAASMYFHLNGHICISKNEIQEFSKELELTEFSLTSLKKGLESSILLGDGSELTPLVYDGNNLYLHRFWKYEGELADWLRNRSEEILPISNETHQFIESLFPDTDNDWQKMAVLLSHLKKLVIITGGPGTGKTFTIQKILESHLQSSAKLKIALSAPTGKAAQRLNESLDSESLLSEIDPAITIHSLLGAKGATGQFNYGTDNKLPYDLIIVDEASMLDLSLWISLIRAVPDAATLVLLGDKNQLASVEAGSILGDICSNASNVFSSSISEIVGLKSVDDEKSKINDSIIELKQSYRFSENSGISMLSEAIINEDSELVLSILKDHKYSGVNIVDPTNESMAHLIQQYVVEPFLKMKEEGFSHEKYRSYQILSALRKGPYGVEYINKSSEKLLKKELGISISKEWYSGRSIIINRNNYSLKLRNGESGYAMLDEFDSPSEVFFEGKEYPIKSSRVSEYEPAYGLTVHKSQGSEFDHIGLVLSNNINAILTKELLYTAVTRARKSVLVISSEVVITSTVQKSIVRSSGLKSKIWLT
tara:strand:- start:9426 stop:11156 length:1731 start_codon:yes stop_codon:yes gene_type:complete